MTKHNRLWIIVLAGLLGSLPGRGTCGEEPGGAEQPPQGSDSADGTIILFPPADVLNKSAADPQRAAFVPPGERRPWDQFENPNGLSGSFLNKVVDSWGQLSSKMEVQNAPSPVARPLPGSKWQTEDALQVPVTGPLFVFGQLGANCDRVQTQDLKVITKTGVAYKWAGWQNCEVEVRGGPALTCEDAVRQDRLKQQSELLLELLAKYPLAGQVKLEYETSASPALSVADRDRLKQDLRLAIPLGSQGKLSVGAKHLWESTPVPKPWTEGMELYIGLDRKW